MTHRFAQNDMSKKYNRACRGGFPENRERGYIPGSQVNHPSAHPSWFLGGTVLISLKSGLAPEVAFDLLP
jgi:hypothetical protein